MEYLLELCDILSDQLNELERMEWATQECELMKERPRNRRVPEEAILRIKEARSLKGQTYRTATAVAAWRERRAAELNTPVRQILSDLGVVAVAQQAPTTIEQLRSLRGVENRHLRDGADAEILTSVQVGLRMAPEETSVKRAPELPRHLRPVVTLVTAWIAQLARDHKLDPALLATRADVEGLLKQNPSCRLTKGWRQALVGQPISQLVNGDAAVAFDGDGHLVLEARSHQSLSQ